MSSPGDDRHVGALLRDARVAAGLSVRDIARAAGTSPATVVNVEKSGRARHSTLQAYVDALPELSAEAVLGGDSDCVPAASHRAWSLYRDVSGVLADSLAVEAVVASDGSASVLRRVRGARSEVASLRDPVERTNVMRLVCLPTSRVARQLVGLEDRPPRGTLVLEDEGVRFEFAFPSALDRLGLSVRRRERLERLPGSEDETAPVPFARGLPVAVSFPVELLSLSVRFEGELPATPQGRAWLRKHREGLESVDLARELHAGGLVVRVDERRRALTLTVARPLIGLEYAVAWS